jgi:hypothetical protein
VKFLLIALGPERFRWFMMTHWVLCPDDWPSDVLFLGRKVVVRRGKSGISLPGMVVNIARGSLNQIFNKIGHKNLVPVVEDRSSARAMAQRFIGTHNRYVAFKWRTD